MATELPLGFVGKIDAQQVKHGRHEVDTADAVVDIDAFCATGKLNDQRHVNQFLVERKTVIDSPMFKKLGAMIRRQHEDRFVHQSKFGEFIDKSLELGIGPLNLLVVDRSPETHVLVAHRERALLQTFFAQ